MLRHLSCLDAMSNLRHQRRQIKKCTLMKEIMKKVALWYIHATAEVYEK